MSAERLTNAEIQKRLRPLTRAQQAAYHQVASTGHAGRYSSDATRTTTLQAVVDAGLAEWRSAYPDVHPDAHHYIVPIGTPTHAEVIAEKRRAGERRLQARATGIVERAKLTDLCADDAIRLVTEIIRDLTRKDAR